MILTATGHRVINNLKCRNLIYTKLIECEPDRVIIGAAEGFDTMVGWACVFLDIPFYVYLSHRMSHRDPDLMAHARKIEILSEHYYPRCHLIRDEKMVQEGTDVIAWYDGRKEGGTFYTVNYADKLNKPVFNIYK